jgi:hypothetical protein
MAASRAPLLATRVVRRWTQLKPGTDDANALVSIRVRHDYESPWVRGTEKHVPILILRVDGRTRAIL